MKPWPKPPPRARRQPRGLSSKPTPRLASARRTYAAARQIVWERDHGLCVICGRAGEQTHHRDPRGMGGSSRRPEANTADVLILVCAACHFDRIEHDRDAAKTAGWLVPMGQIAAETPVWRFAEWVLLDADGGVSRVADRPPLAV